MKKPDIVRSLQFFGSIATRFFQDDQCVNALRKLGTDLLQVKVHLFGVRLVSNLVYEAAGVRANRTGQVAVSVEMILHHRRSFLRGPDTTQYRTLSDP